MLCTSLSRMMKFDDDFKDSDIRTARDKVDRALHGTKNLGQILSDTMHNAKENVEDAAKQVEDDVTESSLFGNVMDRLSNMKKRVEDQTKSVIPSGLIASAKETAGDVKETVLGAADSALESVQSGAKTLKDFAQDTAESVEDTAKDAASAARRGVGRAVNKLEKVKEKAKDKVKSAVNARPNVRNVLNKGVELEGKDVTENSPSEAPASASDSLPFNEQGDVEGNGFLAYSRANDWSGDTWWWEHNRDWSDYAPVQVYNAAAQPEQAFINTRWIDRDIQNYQYATPVVFEPVQYTTRSYVPVMNIGRNWDSVDTAWIPESTVQDAAGFIEAHSAPALVIPTTYRDTIISSDRSSQPLSFTEHPAQQTHRMYTTSPHSYPMREYGQPRQLVVPDRDVQDMLVFHEPERVIVRDFKRILQPRVDEMNNEQRNYLNSSVGRSNTLTFPPDTDRSQYIRDRQTRVYERAADAQASALEKSIRQLQQAGEQPINAQNNVINSYGARPYGSTQPDASQYLPAVDYESQFPQECPSHRQRYHDQLAKQPIHTHDPSRGLFLGFLQEARDALVSMVAFHHWEHDQTLQPVGNTRMSVMDRIFHHPRINTKHEEPVTSALEEVFGFQSNQLQDSNSSDGGIVESVANFISDNTDVLATAAGLLTGGAHLANKQKEQPEEHSNLFTRLFEKPKEQPEEHSTLFTRLFEKQKKPEVVDNTALDELVRKVAKPENQQKMLDLVHSVQQQQQKPQKVKTETADNSGPSLGSLASGLLMTYLANKGNEMRGNEGRVRYEENRGEPNGNDWNSILHAVARGVEEGKILLNNMDKGAASSQQQQQQHFDEPLRIQPKGKVVDVYTSRAPSMLFSQQDTLFMPPPQQQPQQNNSNSFIDAKDDVGNPIRHAVPITDEELRRLKRQQQISLTEEDVKFWNKGNEPQNYSQSMPVSQHNVAADSVPFNRLTRRPTMDPNDPNAVNYSAVYGAYDPRIVESISYSPSFLERIANMKAPVSQPGLPRGVPQIITIPLTLVRPSSSTDTATSSVNTSANSATPDTTSAATPISFRNPGTTVTTTTSTSTSPPIEGISMSAPFKQHYYDTEGYHPGRPDRIQADSLVGYQMRLMPTTSNQNTAVDARERIRSLTRDHLESLKDAREVVSGSVVAANALPSESSSWLKRLKNKLFGEKPRSSTETVESYRSMAEIYLGATDSDTDASYSSGRGETDDSDRSDYECNLFSDSE